MAHLMSSWSPGVLLPTGTDISAAGVHTRVLFLGPFIALIPLRSRLTGPRGPVYIRPAFTPYQLLLPRANGPDKTGRQTTNCMGVDIQQALRFAQHYRLHIEYISQQFFPLLST
jgi:hypothetical protein